MMEMAPGCYQSHHCHVEVVAVFTNTVSTGPYRGAGRPEAVLTIERLIETAARHLGLDRLAIRRKNFIRRGLTWNTIQVTMTRPSPKRYGSRTTTRCSRTAMPHGRGASWSGWASRPLWSQAAASAFLKAGRYAWSVRARSRCLPEPAPTARGMRRCSRRWSLTNYVSPWRMW
jgi:CO/xanthine dehydrogenase Mo-binding subunit